MTSIFVVISRAYGQNDLFRENRAICMFAPVSEAPFCRPVTSAIDSY